MSSPSSVHCHDLKSERSDVGQPLPAYLRLLPVAFYVTAAAAILLSAFFYWQFRAARSQKESFITQEKQEQKTLGDVQGVVSGLKTESRKAEEVLGWVQGAREIQALCLAVTRSMQPDSTIAELTFERQTENPEQIRMELKLNGAGAEQTKQIDRTLAELQAINYRSYSAQQNQDKGFFNFSSTLIYQVPGS